MENIQNGYIKRMDEMANRLNVDSPLLINDFEVANLGYLIEHNFADVKIAFMMKDEASICHIKAGLFADGMGNKVYFEGSGNETLSGTMRNAENYTISTSFASAEQTEDVRYGENKFNEIWNNCYSPTVRTEFPIGRLFEALKSLSRGKIFNNQSEFFKDQNCVFIDIDEDEGAIFLFDFTDKHWLRNPMVLKTYYGNCWNETSQDNYLINQLSLHDLRDKIIPSIEKFRINCVLSDRARKFLDLNDLELKKRLKLGLAIKENREEEIWGKEYSDFSFVVNSEMIARLKPQQMHNAFFHYEMISSADFSVPGTGKTYISYGLFAYLSSKIIQPKCNHLVVFGPINCFKAWKEEGAAIFGDKRNLSFFDIQEHKTDYFDILRNQKFDVYLINYDFLGSENEKTPRKLSLLVDEVLDEKTMVVFDEIHKLKSLSGVTANNFMRLIDKCKRPPIYRLALTGTPLPNSFADVFNYLKILYSEDIYSSFSDISIDKLKQADDNPQIAERVINTLLPIFVRTTKKDLEVPSPDPDDFASLKVVPTNVEKRLYELIWKSFDNSLLKYIRLIQASSNPSLLKKKIVWGEMNSWLDDGDETIAPYVSEDNLCINSAEIEALADQVGLSSKTKITLDKMSELVSQGKKVLVWCLFIDTINLVTEYLTSKGIVSESICGRDDPKERDEKINLFKFGNTQVLVTNPNTLAESVSLHMVCHDAVYLEYGFNLTYMLQSKDRINRVGLSPETHTHYYYSVSDNCGRNFSAIDQLILEKLDAKSKRMLTTIESGKLGIVGDSSTEIDDIKYILRKGSGF